jgi:hypothetical protein
VISSHKRGKPLRAPGLRYSLLVPAVEFGVRPAGNLFDEVSRQP